VTCDAAVVIGREGAESCGERQGLPLAGSQQTGFSKGAEGAGRFAQFALGRFAVNLHHLFAGRVSCVFHGDAETDGVFSHFRSAWGDGKVGVGQAEAEGIEHLIRGKGLKVAVSHINVFAIEIAGLTAVIPERRVILDAPGNGVGQLP